MSAKRFTERFDKRRSSPEDTSFPNDSDHLEEGKESAGEWISRVSSYSKDARWDIVGEQMKIMEDGFCKDKECVGHKSNINTLFSADRDEGASCSNI